MNALSDSLKMLFEAPNSTKISALVWGYSTPPTPWLYHLCAKHSWERGPTMILMGNPDYISTREIE